MKSLLIASTLALTLALPAYAAGADAPENLFTLPLSAFKPSEKNASQRLYLKPGVQLKNYNAVLLEPLYFMKHDPDGNWQLLQSAEENKIAAYYQQKMTEELHQVGIPVTREAGPGVARMRVAVTGLAQERPGIDVVDILPVKAVFNLTRLAAGKEPYLMKIGSMAQLEDAQSGSLLAGSVNLRESSKTTQKNAPMSLKTVEGLLDDWCEDSAKLLQRSLASTKPAQP